MKKVFDRRRLCTEADLFQTRKSGKTELGAAIDFAQFMFMGDAKAFERYVRRRNELIIELQLAEMPVHKQHEEVGVNIDFTTTKLINY